MAKKSEEPAVTDYCGKILHNAGVKRYYRQQETINKEIDDALAKAPSKSGGTGGNRPDLSLLLDDRHGRYIPVMIEAKGTEGKLEKLTYEKLPEMLKKDGTENFKVVSEYAVNGAVHYANAVINGTSYKECIAIGINGSEVDENGDVSNFEVSAYYISERNHMVPKKMSAIDSTLKMFAPHNIQKLYWICDNLNLTDNELEKLKKKEETTLEERIKKIHQRLYDDEQMKTVLGTNDKLYLFCGLIMAGLSIGKVAPLTSDSFHGNDNPRTNDGKILLAQVEAFLDSKHCSQEKADMIVGLIKPVFENEALWKPHNGISALKGLFAEVKEEIVPCLESDLHLDFMGKILNSINDWVQIENDSRNDVVLTPRYITSFMAKLAHTDMNSYVWDRAMGSGGFLVSAMDIMIRDAQNKIHDQKLQEQKINDIKTKQIFGIEILGNIYILAALNMILMGDGSSNMINADSHHLTDEQNSFPATVFLLNPPYSAPGKGFNFVQETVEMMTDGYACILIQENAGSGQGEPYTKNILKKCTLLASIHMPAQLFTKVGVQTAIYLFKVGRPHEADDLVKFFDMSEDGYSRQNRKKSTQEVNLRNTDHADERYAEVEARILGKKPKTEYYTKENGLLIEDTISLNGDDWTFAQHKKVDTMPTEEDFRKTVSDYLSWKVGCILKEEKS